MSWRERFRQSSLRHELTPLTPPKNKAIPEIQVSAQQLTPLTPLAKKPLLNESLTAALNASPQKQPRYSGCNDTLEALAQTGWMQQALFHPQCLTRLQAHLLFDDNHVALNAVSRTQERHNKTTSLLAMLGFQAECNRTGCPLLPKLTPHDTM